MTARCPCILAVCVLCSPAYVVAQSDSGRFELGAQVISANVSEFDQTDVGIGARFTWNHVQHRG